ncbi:unknown [Bacteroides sp. CAG:462]|nr:unknown [Bacteroides sp. CAG:462]
MRIFAAIYKLPSFRRLSADGHSPMGGGFSSRFAADASAPSYGLVTTLVQTSRYCGTGLSVTDSVRRRSFMRRLTYRFKNVI